MVAVPLLVPFISTDAKGKTFPFSSVTLPDIFPAKAVKEIIRRDAVKKAGKYFFIKENKVKEHNENRSVKVTEKRKL